MPAGLVALDGDQVMRAALGDQVLGAGELGVQRVCGDHRPGQVNAVLFRSKFLLIGLAIAFGTAVLAGLTGAAAQHLC